MFQKLLNKLYLFYFKWKNKKNGCIFTRNSCISSTDVFEGNNYISGKVCDCYVGWGTYISNGCLLKNCKIGRFCSIAPDVKILCGDHPTSQFVSTSPAFYFANSPVGMSYTDVDLFEENKKEVIIGNDVWIGQSVLIKPGVVIGDGAIIGAGAVVTKNVAPYAIVVGVPA